MEKPKYCIGDVVFFVTKGGSGRMREIALANWGQRDDVEQWMYKVKGDGNTTAVAESEIIKKLN